MPVVLTGQTDFPAFRRDLYLHQGEWPLPYRILLPENFDPDQAYPLVLFLHGAGERGSDNQRSLMHGAALFLRDSVRQKYPAIVVFPQCPAEEYWTRVVTGSDGIREFPFWRKPVLPLQAVMGLLDHLEHTYRINPEQRYVGGLSMGGFGTFSLVARMPNYFAAAFPICGGGNAALAPMLRQTPFWIFHGSRDDIVLPVHSRKMVEALRASGGTVRYTEYPQANHNSWDAAFAEPGLLPWLFAQRRMSPHGRYLSPVFGQVDRTTYEYAVIEGQSLKLDVYQPAADPLARRPLILYVHGGGFAGGRRDEGRYVQFAQRMAERGFCVASISYRLTRQGDSFGCDQTAAVKINTFREAALDIRSATQYILRRSADWGIDPQRIILAGSSAGAEAILHAAFWSDADLPSNAPSLPDTFRYAGVVSMAGALVDTALITAQTAIPALLYHGTCDNLVPFDAAPHHYCAQGAPGYLTLFGANALARRLYHVGGHYKLVAACGGGHEWNDRPLLTLTAQMSRDLYQLMILRKPLQETERLNTDADCLNKTGQPCSATWVAPNQ